MIGMRLMNIAGIALGLVILVPAPGLSDRQPPVPPEQRIEILIRNSDFFLPKPMGLVYGLPTVLILRNHDIIPHGFTSSMLSGMSVTGEGEDITIYGKGIEGFYVNPGKTLVIRFTPKQEGRYEFRCDLHSQMTGEILLLDMSNA